MYWSILACEKWGQRTGGLGSDNPRSKPTALMPL